ncbi:MAG: hypothetical protein AAGD14_05870 [Planctomycetota bacterium]
MRAIGILLCLVSFARADALVTVDAMNATTIAEIFVERSEIRVELEVGAADADAFAPPTDSWRLEADGVALTPRDRTSSVSSRIQRDPITGEPVGESKEPVGRVRLLYARPPAAKSITLRAPPGTTVGFVLYHEGVAVNDFRYLPGVATVDLDPDDPWYSRFRHRNLRRRYDAPIQVFLYVEPWEIRKELLVRPRDLGLTDGDTIPVEVQAQLKERARDLLAKHGAVTVDGAPVAMELDRIHFVRRTLRQTGVIDPPEELTSVSAMLGVVYVHPRAGTLPKDVRLRWELFPERVAFIPAVATDEAGGLPARITRDDPELIWSNYLKDPRDAGFVDVPAPSRPLPIFAIALACFAVPFLRRRKWAVGIALLVAAAALVPARRAPDPGPAVVEGLLRNVYRAFDMHGEEPVYDALARSLEGPDLRQAYLQLRRSLELRNQGGARVKVHEVALLEADPADCAWEVTGTVGHWGHLHQRTNRYRAVLRLEPVNGQWKITALEVRDEERLR